MTVSDNELVSKAQNHTVEALLLCASIKDSPRLQSLLLRYFQLAASAIDEHIQLKGSDVTPEVLAEDVIDACALEGWDCSLMFWDYDNPRYGSVEEGDNDDGGDSGSGDQENPSQSAARIAQRLLEHYEMKPRT